MTARTRTLSFSPWPRASGPIRQASRSSADAIDEVAGRSRVERDLAVAHTKLAVAEARIVELSARIERSEGEVAFLRSLLGAVHAEVA